MTNQPQEATLPLWVYMVVVSIGVAFFLIILFNVLLPKNHERNERQKACETQQNVLLIEREVGLVGMEVSGRRYGCLITWPDGSTQLVDYEAYK